MKIKEKYSRAQTTCRLGLLERLVVVVMVREQSVVLVVVWKPVVVVVVVVVIVVWKRLPVLVVEGGRWPGEVDGVRWQVVVG